MIAYRASAARLTDGIIEHACQSDAPPVVQDLATLLADIMVEHPNVKQLVISVEVDQ